MAPTLKKSPLEEIIQQEVARFGPMTFAQFVERTLYHPTHGYYNQKKIRRGRAGDYFTSNQVSPLFGQIWADALFEMRKSMGSSFFSLIEVGSGDGEFLEAILKTWEAQKKLDGVRIYAVERSRPARERLWRKLSRFPKCQVIPDLDAIEQVGGLEGCLITNELMDALPFHRLRFSNTTWKEIFIGVKKGSLVELEGELSDPNLISGLSGQKGVEGQQIEVRPKVESLLTEWSQTLSRGYIVTIDYGYPKAELYSSHRKNGTWMCFSKHKSNTEPYKYMGEQDITAHVDFTDVMVQGKKVDFEPSLYCSQGIFLTHVGQNRIGEYLRVADSTEGHRRAGVIQQLLHPETMGSTFKVFIQSKTAPLPESFQVIPNRIHRLSN